MSMTAAYREAHKAEIAAYQKAYRERNRERLSAQHREFREQNADRIRARQRKWYKENRERVLSHIKENPEIGRAAARRTRERHPERVAARKLVWSEVEAGRFPPANTMVCDICQEALAVHWHHHSGYGPGHELDVIAVCRPCHTAAHRKEATDVK
jgi:hypothetical protein